MSFNSSLITDNQQYLILLATVMLLSFWAKKTQVFLPVYKFIADKVKSKRAVVALISLVSGVLPVNGRASISAGALDTVAPNNEKKKVCGIIDYSKIKENEIDLNLDLDDDNNKFNVILEYDIVNL